jgi:hypothetical protein
MSQVIRLFPVVLLGLLGLSACASVPTMDHVAASHRIIHVQMNKAEANSYALMTTQGTQLGVASPDGSAVLRFELPSSHPDDTGSHTLYLLDEASREPVDPTGYDAGTEWGFEHPQWEAYLACVDQVRNYITSPAEAAHSAVIVGCSSWPELAPLLGRLAAHAGQHRGVLAAHESVRTAGLDLKNAEASASEEAPALAARLAGLEGELDALEAPFIQATGELRRATVMMPQPESFDGKGNALVFKSVAGSLRNQPPRATAGDVKTR